MPIRSYRVADTDTGVQKCIDNASNLLESANILLESNKKDHSYILFTFAVEEFGKALYLFERKKDAEEKGLDMIKNDPVTFKDHDEKLKKAESYNPSLGVKLIDESTIPTLDPKKLLESIDMPEFQFKGRDEFQYEGSFLRFENRLNLLYVDYDEERKAWRTPPSLPLALELSFAFEALAEALQCWKTKFSKQ
jgi:AbiV family abortive infection protein